ncbi:hypothetical protein [Emticicia sp. C21]|uniref:hypothetical protein n=1 Tax=Emticicia sp. C21 TaxID=2302915 RepID=UPI000E342FB2|nr:hypothetical protein [Emticicia sp. C21]RFS17752.1 hypothetical protein D0T08_00420 [Emticicia sp. C21]
MKQVLTSLFVLIVLSNSYYADDTFASDNTVYTKKRSAKNVFLSKSGSSSSVNKKVIAVKENGSQRKNKGGVGSGGRNICISKRGASSGNVNKKVCASKCGVGSGGRSCNA